MPRSLWTPCQTGGVQTQWLLPRARPEGVDIDPAGVWYFLDALACRRLEVHSLLLARRGRVVFEGYWEPYSDADAPELYSLSKTFVSAAVGIAVGDGLLSYDDRLVDLFADVLPAGAGPRASRIRVRDCLAMSTGHTADTVLTPAVMALPGRTPWARTLAVEPDGEPGEVFCYNQWATWTLAEIVRRAAGRDVLGLLEERVFAPLGITGATWGRDARGRILGATGLHLRSEQIAAFFQLLARDGVWEGRRLLPAPWIEQYRLPHADTTSWSDPDWSCGYGWQVWLNTTQGHRGDGAFGQFGLVWPQLDAVCVITAATDRTQELLDQVWTHLLPAFGRPPELPTDQVAGRLADLRIRPVDGDRGGRVHLTFENRENRWRLTDDAEGWRLRWVDAQGGDNAIAVGHHRWRRSVMSWGGRSLPVAASGGWVSWGYWVGHLVTLGAPHGLVVHLRDDGSGCVVWVTTPLRTNTLSGLAMPAARGSR